ncbi:MAG: hypothetical protein AABZ74_13200 [Cyanobacteriota bacterium]
MKKLKLLSLFLVMGIFSCPIFNKTVSNVPVEIIKIKETKDIKLSYKPFISNLCLDSNENFYFIDGNVIKKVDQKGNLTIIAGKEEDDFYPEDGNIDGDLSTAKFGEIIKMNYVENEKLFYFVEKFKMKDNKDKYNYFARKLSNNKIETIYKIGNIDKKDNNSKNYRINFISKEGEIYFEEYIRPNWSGMKITKDNQVIKVEGSGNFLDYEGTFYSLRNESLDSYSEDYSLYVRVENKWKKIIDGTLIHHLLNISIDKNNNVYIVEDFFRQNLDGDIMSNSYQPPLIHKISKKNILELKEPLALYKKEFVIAELYGDDSIVSEHSIIVSEDGNRLYGFNQFNSNNIVKVNIGSKK